METPPTVSEPQSPTAPASMFLGARLFNVFVAPGEVFDFIKAAKVSAANWLVPALLLIAVSWAGSWVVLSKDFSKQQLNEVTMASLEKQLAKMPAEQAERVREQTARYAGKMQTISIAAAPLFVGLVFPFLWGLILWLVGTRVLKGSFGYMKAVEVVGLSNMLQVLEAVVKPLLILAMGSIFATPSLALLIKEPDPQKASYVLLAIFNIISFWVLAVRSSGLARLSNVSFGKAAMWVFGIWAIYTGLMVGGGLAAKAAFGG